MQGATVLTRFTADTKDLENKTGKAETTIAGLTKSLIASQLVVRGLSASYDLLKKFLGESVNAFADVEQSIGGVETIFGENADMVVENAKKAYKTAGLSANQYMEQVTSFSASLLQSTAGDTKASAEIADMALQDMADNANKFGTSMESIQNAYQGFAKQNYTMLDNLKLGYGGTKTEMERLLADAEKISGVKYDIKNLGDVYKAINVIQKKMKITGTTAKEASTTIKGSMASAKSAFQNFIAGQGGIEDVISTFITAGQNISQAIIQLLPQLVEGLVGLINGLLPLVPDILKALLPGMITGAIDLTMGIIQILPDLILMIAEMLPTLLPQIVEAIMQVIPMLIEMIPQFLVAGGKLIGGLIEGILKSIPKVLEGAWEVVKSIVEIYQSLPSKMLEIGKNIIKGLWNGIKGMKDWVVKKVKKFAEDFLQGMKDVLGISSPSKEFALIGKFSVLGYTEALDDMQKDVQKQVNETFGISPQFANSSALSYTPNVVVNNNISMRQDPLGQMVNDIKTFSGGSKNDFNYGMGG